MKTTKLLLGTLLLAVAVFLPACHEHRMAVCREDPVRFEDSRSYGHSSGRAFFAAPSHSEHRDWDRGGHDRR
jgi:hypothetical protein